MFPLVEAIQIGRESQTGKVLLSDVSFSVNAGDQVALTGANGSGKSVCLRALSMLDPIQTGDVRWREKSVANSDMPAFRRDVHYVQQTPAMISGTVIRNLIYPYALSHAPDKNGSTSEDSVRRRAKLMLDRLDWDVTLLDQDAQHLSGGEAQVVGLIRALLISPSVLLLDEPTAAMSEMTAEATESLLINWTTEHPEQRAFVWVSHRESQIDRFATRRIEMTAGQIEEVSLDV